MWHTHDGSRGPLVEEGLRASLGGRKAHCVNGVTLTQCWKDLNTGHERRPEVPIPLGQAKDTIDGHLLRGEEGPDMAFWRSYHLEKGNDRNVTGASSA
eukprot:CAMPEP_0167799520 /NCGR_PEP_ID=MMETSP0111_2-20121227/17083_1 /TAXON_ID=91324 /ORGANISM="Lotharella globosa, Strain CCCM811" /LENGTH=97 /DNA_ID=CAMNT_0007694401 /DNA_START=227 /DNA_END=521 /DNA_ORIENTATION=+